MKKVILLAVGSVFFVVTSFIGRQTPREEVFTLSFTSQEIQTLWYALKKSNAEHSIVAPLEESIQIQINQQVKAQEEAKKKQDTLPQPKKKK